MKRHRLGVSYLVEPGVEATVRGFVRSTGYSGKKCVHLQIVDGTDHLFTPEVIGATVLDLDGDVQPTNRMIENGIILVSSLPESVRSRYRLDGIDGVAISIHEPGYFKSFSDQTW